VAHSAAARSWAKDERTEKSKNKAKSVFQINTHSRCLSEHIPVWIPQEIAKKKKIAKQRKPKEKERLQGSAYVFAWALRASDSAPHKSLSSSAFIRATQATQHAYS